jgi:hypothetical protein
MDSAIPSSGFGRKKVADRTIQLKQSKREVASVKFQLVFLNIQSPFDRLWEKGIGRAHPDMPSDNP